MRRCAHAAADGRATGAPCHRGSAAQRAVQRHARGCGDARAPPLSHVMVRVYHARNDDQVRAVNYLQTTPRTGCISQMMLLHISGWSRRQQAVTAADCSWSVYDSHCNPRGVLVSSFVSTSSPRPPVRTLGAAQRQVPPTQLHYPALRSLHLECLPDQERMSQPHGRPCRWSGPTARDGACLLCPPFTDLASGQDAQESKAHGCRGLRSCATLCGVAHKTLALPALRQSSTQPGPASQILKEEFQDKCEVRNL